MAELHLHVGLPKTGSSALQRFLIDNRQALSRQGILVPGTGQRADGPHHRLLAGLSGMTDQSRSAVLRNLLEEIEDTRPESVVLSSELALPLLRSGLLTPALRHLRAARLRLRFHLFVRPQAEAINSAFPEVLRTALLPLTFEGFLARRHRLFDYRRIAARLDRSAPLTVHPYLRQRSNGGPWDSLLKSLGLPPTPDAWQSPPRIKPRPGPLTTAFFGRVAQEIEATGPIRRLSARIAARNALHDASPFLPAEPSAFNGLDRRAAIRVTDEYADSNAWLARRFLSTTWDDAFGEDRATVASEPNALDPSTLTGDAAADFADAVTRATALALTEIRRSSKPRSTKAALADRAGDWALRSAFQGSRAWLPFGR